MKREHQSGDLYTLVQLKYTGSTEISKQLKYAWSSEISKHLKYIQPTNNKIKAELTDNQFEYVNI